MKDKDKTKEQLIDELRELRRRIDMATQIFRFGRLEAESTKEPSMMLGEILVERGYLTEPKLRSTLHSQQGAKLREHEYKQLGMMLLADGTITNDQLQAALEEQLIRLHRWLDTNEQPTDV